MPPRSKNKLTLLTLLILVFGYCYNINAQNQVKVDSLLALLPIENDSLSSVIYEGLRKQYHYVDFDQAEIYAKSALEFAEKSEDRSLIINAREHLGTHFAAKGEASNADSHYLYAIDELLKDGKIKRAAKIYLTWGYSYCGRAYYDEGMKKFQEAYSIVSQDKSGDPVKGECLLALGMLHGSIKNYDQSDDYLEQAIAFFENIKEDEMRHETIMMLGVNRYENGKNEEANKDFLTAMAYFEKNGNLSNLVRGYSNLGASYLGLDDYDEAEFYFQKGYKAAKENHYEHLELVMLERLAEVKMYQNEHLEAIPLWKDALPKSIALEDIRAQSKEHQFLTICYDTLGNYELAYLHHRQFVKLQDSILSQEKLAQINELETKYDTERKEQEIKLLEEKAKRNSLERKGMLAGILGLLGLMGLLIYAGRQRIIKNKLAKDKVDQQLAFNIRELDLKKQELTAYALQVAHKNEVLEGIKANVNDIKVATGSNRALQKIVNTIDINQNDDESWEGFRARFLAVHKDFEVEMKLRFPAVTVNELRLMALLKMQLTSKEIANILNISAEGIKKARYRLRKKLGLQPSDSLEDLVLAIG